MVGFLKRYEALVILAASFAGNRGLAPPPEIFVSTRARPWLMRTSARGEIICRAARTAAKRKKRHLVEKAVGTLDARVGCRKPSASGTKL